MKSGSDKNKKRKSDKSSNDSDGYQLDGSSEKDEARNGKKRFVWPDSLHKDFISAVFDIGLKTAMKDEILELMPKHLPPSNSFHAMLRELTSEQVRGQIERIKLFRIRVPGVYVSHYDAHLQSLKRNKPPNDPDVWLHSTSKALWKQSIFSNVDNAHESFNHSSIGMNHPSSSSSSSSSAADPYEALGQTWQPADLESNNVDGREALIKSLYNLTADMNAMLSIIDQQSKLVNTVKASVAKQMSSYEELKRRWVAINNLAELEGGGVGEESSVYYSNSSTDNFVRNRVDMREFGEMEASNAANASSGGGSPYALSNKASADIIVGMSKLTDASRLAFDHSQYEPDEDFSDHANKSQSHQLQRELSESYYSDYDRESDRPGRISRKELSIMSEMRAQMEIHRQLLSKKQNQLQLHNGNGVGNRGSTRSRSSMTTTESMPNTSANSSSYSNYSSSLFHDDPFSRESESRNKSGVRKPTNFPSSSSTSTSFSSSASDLLQFLNPSDINMGQQKQHQGQHGVGTEEGEGQNQRQGQGQGQGQGAVTSAAMWDFDGNELFSFLDADMWMGHESQAQTLDSQSSQIHCSFPFPKANNDSL